MRQPPILFQLLFTAFAALVLAAPSHAQIGACCQGNGTCINTDQRGCSTLGGTFLGAGTSCATSSCTGACCLPGGGCTVVSASACTSQSGTFQGLGSSCASHCPGPLSNAFAYQGRLLAGGEPVTGSVNLVFKLFDTGVGGAQVGTTITANGVAVAGGMFSIDLDFGDLAQTFNGAARWLEVAVNNTVLAPRQRVTAAPYALHATYSAATHGIDVDEGGNVGIGTNAPAHPLHVESSQDQTIFAQNAAISGNAVFGLATATGASADGIGVYGETAGSAGQGVFGFSSAAGGTPVGVMGQAAGLGGAGVLGKGVAFGVKAEASGNNGVAVFAVASGTSSVGATGASQGSSGIGVYGHATSSTGSTRAVIGEVSSASGFAAYFIGTTGSKNYFQRAVGINTFSPDQLLSVAGNASKTGGGSWAVFSDARLKKNVQPLHGSLDQLLSLHGVSFEFIDPESINELPGTRIGMIAQEVERVFPDWVSDTPRGYKSLSFSGFEALTVEAFRELRAEKDEQIRSQQTQIDALRVENEELRSTNEAIHKRLEALEARGLSSAR